VTAKREREATSDWAEKTTPEATVRKRTWPVMVHGGKGGGLPARGGRRECETHRKREHSVLPRTENPRGLPARIQKMMREGMPDLVAVIRLGPDLPSQAIMDDIG
jgi:hypothetical protein